MKLARRSFLKLTAGAVTLPAISRTAWGQAYPSRPVHIVVGFPPGGLVDISARLIAQWLSERTGQPFIVDNRPGVAGNIAAEAVVKAPADGYTLLLANAANAISATLYEKLNFDFIRDIALIGGINRTPNVMQINPSVPVRTVPEFIAYAKANPGKVSFGHSGVGTSTYMSGELFRMMAGVNFLHVPYRGGAPALTDVLGGQVQGMFDNLPTSLEHIRAGRLRALAVTTAVRSELLPEVPALSEFLPGYEASAWNGIGVPKHTPHEIVDKLNVEINAGLVDPKIKARIADMGGAPMPGTPADFDKFIVAETEKWAKVIKFAGIKPE